LVLRWYFRVLSGVQRRCKASDGLVAIDLARSGIEVDAARYRVAGTGAFARASQGSKTRRFALRG
jgi:hypothetical protein